MYFLHRHPRQSPQSATTKIEKRPGGTSPFPAMFSPRQTIGGLVCIRCVHANVERGETGPEQVDAENYAGEAEGERTQECRRINNEQVFRDGYLHGA